MNKKLPELQTHRDEPFRLGSSQQFYRKLDSKKLARIHYGSYIDSTIKPTRQEHHDLKVKALRRRGLGDYKLVGTSAASYWKIWLIRDPIIVEILRSHTGQRNGKGYRRVVTFLSDPQFVTLDDGLPVLARLDTVVSLVVQVRRDWAVAAMDCLLRQMVFGDHLGEDTARAQIELVVQRLTSGTKRQLATDILDIASPLSMSPGESLSRVIVNDAGLEAPQLQAKFEDEYGLIAYVDAFFAESRVVGEFDGMVKYRKAEFMNGKSVEDVVIAEKRREDRLRRLGLKVVRWTWDDIQVPGRLEQLLRDAGVRDAKRR